MRMSESESTRLHCMRRHKYISDRCEREHQARAHSRRRLGVTVDAGVGVGNKTETVHIAVAKGDMGQ